ncbi:hypothetical protein SCOR_13755 [Sulfidibacter corallicola]|uniref:Uncharacterized protein n=1 Tax=Sulfidibacter corallicola TaxID=2818388 RepID=A0A8A4TDH2_SULCO|nr:hypothetical protein [Sulfidibacter corallicola]QTD47617.1 hypothetical protein J3U87_18655 [Sulfidibacter corallicola]
MTTIQGDRGVLAAVYQNPNPRNAATDVAADRNQPGLGADRIELSSASETLARSAVSPDPDPPDRVRTGTQAGSYRPDGLVGPDPDPPDRARTEEQTQGDQRAGDLLGADPDPPDNRGRISLFA